MPIVTMTLGMGRVTLLKSADHLWDYGPEYGWASDCPAASRLALAILVEVTKCPNLSLYLCESFAVEFLHSCHPSGFHIAAPKIHLWVHRRIETDLWPELSSANHNMN